MMTTLRRESKVFIEGIESALQASSRKLSLPGIGRPSPASWEAANITMLHSRGINSSGETWFN